MHCQDAKQLLTARRDGDLAESDFARLQAHLQQCSACHAIEQRQQCLDVMLRSSTPRATQGVRTEQIMLAVEQRRQVSQQLADIRQQQQSRVMHLRTAGTVIAAIIFLTMGCIPLLLLAITLIQADLVEKALSPLSSVIDVIFVFGQYLQTGFTIVTRNNWLLAGIAFAIVVMMGMWLRLMRHPQEA